MNRNEIDSCFLDLQLSHNDLGKLIAWREAWEETLREALLSHEVEIDELQQEVDDCDCDEMDEQEVADLRDYADKADRAFDGLSELMQRMETLLNGAPDKP